MQRKPHWVCESCKVTFTVSAPGTCSHCGHKRFHYFPSKKEYQRYQELLMLVRAHEITDLELQPRYDLEVSGKKFRVSFDFRYKDARTDDVIIEDVKTSGTNTDISKLKRALAEDQFGITVMLV